jgi:dynein heavy chain
LISDVTYGGRVTDDWDRRLINVYATEYFNDKVLFEEKHKLADPNQPYYIPEELSTKDKKNMEKYNNSEVVYYY